MNLEFRPAGDHSNAGINTSSNGEAPSKRSTNPAWSHEMQVQ
jgi:hypothetical protein